MKSYSKFVIPAKAGIQIPKKPGFRIKCGMTEKDSNMKKLMVLFTSVVFYFLFTASSHAAEIPKRIISLAPNITEILFAIGLGDNIIGVTAFCDYPEEAKKKKKIGGMTNPSLEAVVSLKPDIVIMTTDGNPKQFQDRLHLFKIKTFVYRARRLSQLPHGIREMGLALGVEERAEALANEIEGRIGRLTESRNSKLKTQNLKSRKVLFIVWPEPLIAAGPGTAIDDAIRLLGCENIASKAKSTYPKYSIEEVIHQSPDVIIIGRGMSQKNIREISRGVLNKMKIVPAVKNNNVCYVSDSLYRLGPRVVKGIEEIAECIK